MDLNAKVVKNNELLQLPNGYYLAKVQEIGNLSLVSAVLVQSNYPYENDELKNKLTTNLQLPQELKIDMDPNVGAPIYNKNDNYLFSIRLTGGKNTTPSQELIIFSSIC